MAFGFLRTDSGRRAMTDINVTPLVDVMLVLLIIFMVTAPLMQSGVKIDLPKATAQQMEHSEEKLVLTITRDRRVLLGDTEIPFAELETKLKANRAAGEGQGALPPRRSLAVLWAGGRGDGHRAERRASSRWSLITEPAKELRQK